MINQNQFSLLPFGRIWDERGEDIIIGDNPLFPIKGFNSNELFQIFDDCETKNVHHRQNFL